MTHCASWDVKTQEGKRAGISGSDWGQIADSFENQINGFKRFIST
jgi:hypothetical protein